MPNAAHPLGIVDRFVAGICVGDYDGLGLCLYCLIPPHAPLSIPFRGNSFDRNAILKPVREHRHNTYIELIPVFRADPATWLSVRSFRNSLRTIDMRTCRHVVVL